MTIIDKNNMVPQYWGDGCKAWYLMDKENMGVFYESMPPNATDELHYHHSSEQFIYVLKGTLQVIINKKSFFLSPFQGILVPMGAHHKVFNGSLETAEFILFAGPNHQDDRVAVDEQTK